MAVGKKLKRGLRSGNLGNSVATLGSVKETVKGGFFQRHKPRFHVPIKKDKPIGKVFWTVESPIEPMHFTKKKDAECFKKMLLVSTAEYNADIIRREVTDKGYEVTYGDRK